jgi:hypothetical protein
MTVFVAPGGGDGPASSGGINWLTFSGDGEISYLGRHPTWVFASTVQNACPLQTRWPIFHPFRSLLNITMNIPTSLRKMRRRNRIRRIRLRMAIPNLQKFIMAIDEELPILEYLIIVSPTRERP